MAVAVGQMFRAGNSTENLFLDYVSDKIQGMGVGAPGVNEFHRTFNEIYGVYVTWPQLQQILQDTSPQQKKLLLRSVFGGMVVRQPGTPLSSLPPLRDAQVSEIADKFAIRAPFEQHVATTQAAQVGFNPLGNFNLDFLQDTNVDAEKFKALKKNVSDAILNTPNGQPFKLDAALNKTELDHHSKQDEASLMFGGLKKVIDNFSTIINPFNVGGDDNFFAFFGQILSKIMGFFMPMLSGFTEMAKNFNKTNKEPHAPLDEEDINKTPELSEKAIEFAELSNTLAGMGGEQGKRLAAELNKEWRVNPNASEIWDKLIKGLAEYAPEEADKWLRSKEQKYIRDLTEIIEAQEKKEIVKLGSIQQPTKDLRADLKSFRRELAKMEDPVLTTYANDEYKRKNFKSRYEAYGQYSKYMDTIKDKFNEKENAIQSRKSAKQQYTSAVAQQGAAGGPNNILSLDERIVKLNQDINDLRIKKTNSQNDMLTAEGNLHGLVPALTAQFKAHYNDPDTQRVKKEAWYKKEEEEKRKAAAMKA